MSLWDDIQPWLDKQTGLLGNANGLGGDNLILFSAYLLRGIFDSDGFAPGEFCVSLSEFVHSVTVKPGLYLRRIGDIGLYLRRIGDIDDNSVDNLIGTAWLSQFIAQQWAIDIHRRWNGHLSCFDVNHPNQFALNKNFYGRFLGLKAYIVACAGDKPWLIQRLLWCLSVWWTVKTSSGASNPLLMSLQVDVMKRWCPKTATYFWNHYSLKELYSEYFWPNFPLTLHAK